MDRTLEELLAVAIPIENGFAWSEMLSPSEQDTVARWMMDLFGIN